MLASELRKRTVLFFIFAGIPLLLVIFLPSENIIQSYLTTQFQVAISPENKIIAADNTPMAQMGETSANLIINLYHIFKIVLWMIFVIAAVRFVNFLIFSTFIKHSSQTEISSLLKTVLSIIICIVAFFVAFQSQYPGVQLAPLFTGSTILGIVVGLALQDTLGNLFAGIALQADQPFQIGDVISISNRSTGVVESVTWRGLKIRTFQNKLLIISNSVLGKEIIEVAPRESLNARLVNFNTLYANSPARTIQATRDAIRQVENVSQKLRPIVRIKNLGESGIEWEIKYWLEDYTKYNDTDALVRQRVWYIFQREQIEFAYPTRTIHVETKPQETAFVETYNALFDLLGKIPIFEPLSDEETEKLARASNPRVYAPGETIVRKGQEGNSMFVIMRGSVNVQIPENGEPKTINHLKENDFFGEMSLLTGQPRSANVVAEEETEVLQIKKAALKPLFETNPVLVEAICDIIEQRRQLLKVNENEPAPTVKKSGNSGVFDSIRIFFGLN